MPVDERMQTYSYVDEHEVIGRDKERDGIIHMFLSAKSDRLLILPIVGIGGLGKMTLAQLVFNDIKVKAHFQNHMWVCVSEKFSVPDIVKRIIDTAVGNDCGLKSDNLELLQVRLREELSQKRYLLVLDDVWNEDEQKWETLRTLLCSCGMGSAVVLTTRSMKVASIAETVSPLCLKHLSPKDSWIVFSRRTFGAGVIETSELVEVGKRIVHKCCGVPLAVKSMGALISTKHGIKCWLSILESNTWDEENQILPALALSYKHLPSHWKQCFVFCAVYPKDYEIDKDDLIHLWISNGFISSNETSDIEDIGNRIFWELVWRSFFQNVEQPGPFSPRKDYMYGHSDVTTCKIHDLMHDLSVHVSGDECFALKNVAEIKKTPKNVHHLVFEHPHTISNVMQHCPIIRSVFSLCKNDKKFIKDIKFKESSLRVLGLHIVGIEIFPVEPAFMKHLRYLDLSCSHIKTLPGAVSALYNLQVLMLNRCGRLTQLPVSMKFMTSLRHVYLEGCYSLEMMPPGLGHLTSLRTLTKYIVGNDSGCGIQEIKDLKLGGKLKIYNLMNITAPIDAKQANLESKKNIQQLALCWGTLKSSFSPTEDLQLYHAEEVLDALKPPSGLTVLGLRQYMGTKFPLWMENGVTLHTIVTLNLIDSINCMELPSVRQLPFLEVLQLEGMKKLKCLCNRYFSDKECDHRLVAFPKLKLLSLDQTESLENWLEHDVEDVTLATFPALETMEIIDCPKLTIMPNVPILKSLSVIGNKILIGLSASLINLTCLYLGVSQRRFWRIRALSYSYRGELEGNSDTKFNISPNYLLSLGSLTKLSLQGFNMLVTQDKVCASDHRTSINFMHLISCDCFVQSNKLQSPLWFWKHFARLEHLTIKYCDSLTCWPEEEFENLTSLKWLYVLCWNDFTGLSPSPLSMKPTYEDLRNLELIHISDCPNLVTFPTPSTSLKSLSVSASSKLESITEGLSRCDVLEELSVSECPTLKSLPASIQCLSNLETLELSDCNSLTALPQGIQNLKALKRLNIMNCPGVEALPEGLQQRLYSLKKLSVEDCPALARRCKRGGDYWDLVKDIPDLNVTCKQRSAWCDAARAVIPTCTNAWH